MRGDRLTSWLADSLWAITPGKLEALLAVVEHWAGGREPSLHAAESRSPAVVRLGSGVRVLPVHGILAPRANLITEYSGGTSMDVLGREFREAVADPRVSTIVLDVDSPGGEVYGVEEMAREILRARSRKPIVAVANPLAASGAYWLASSASTLVATPSGDVGSIGVFAIHTDRSGAEERAGRRHTIVRAGRYKAESNPYEPLGDEAHGHLQARVDEAYRKFTAHVAAARGVQTDTVRKGFGEGRVLGSDQARAAGMVDRIATLNQVLAELSA